MIEYIKLCLSFAILNTVRTSNTCTANNKVAMWPVDLSTQLELLHPVYITCHKYHALSPDYKTFSKFLRDNLIERHSYIRISVNFNVAYPF